MERSNQPPEPECCRREGEANAAQVGGGAERLVGGVRREIHEPQAGVAPCLILVRFQVETNDPRPGADASHPVPIRSQPRQALFQGSHHPGHV